ncbi:TPA: ddrA [Serratia fonticola]
MKLSALERLDLTDRLDELMRKSAAAKGLDKLDCDDLIDEVMTKLGYGAAKAAPVPPVPEKNDTRPHVVAEFLEGKYDSSEKAKFIDVLDDLTAFVGEYLSFEDVQIGASNWVRQNHPEAA